MSSHAPVGSHGGWGVSLLVQLGGSNKPLCPVPRAPSLGAFMCAAASAGVGAAATARSSSVASFGTGYTVSPTTGLCGLGVVASRRFGRFGLLFGLATPSLATNGASLPIHPLLTWRN